MKRVVLTAQAAQYETMRGTILFRQDIEIFWNEDINSSVSMLVETLISLDVGSVYEFRFAGIKGTSDLPAISARVAGLVKGPEAASRLQHYAMEFVGISKEAMEEILKKIVHA